MFLVSAHYAPFAGTRYTRFLFETGRAARNWASKKFWGKMGEKWGKIFPKKEIDGLRDAAGHCLSLHLSSSTRAIRIFLPSCSTFSQPRFFQFQTVRFVTFA
jgi:hypothetical protein